MEANQPTKCNCLIRHAVTSEERARAMDALEYARAVGDTLGTYLALEALVKCPPRR